MSCHLLFIQLFSSIAASVSIKLLFCSMMLSSVLAAYLGMVSVNFSYFFAPHVFDISVSSVCVCREVL